jgi:hypothetical protein
VGLIPRIGLIPKTEVLNSNSTTAKKKKNHKLFIKGHDHLSVHEIMNETEIEVADYNPSTWEAQAGRS